MCQADIIHYKVILQNKTKTSGEKHCFSINQYCVFAQKRKEEAILSSFSEDFTYLQII